MDNPKSRCSRDWKPDVDDDNDYEYRDGYWHIYHDEGELTVEKEAATDRAYRLGLRRAEWNYYHPDEACPGCEL